MSAIVKIKPIGLSKINTAEYKRFMDQFRELISEANSSSDEGGESQQGNGGSSALGIPEEQLAAFDINLALLLDLIKESHISDETARMHKIDRRRNKLIIYLTSMVRLMTKSPNQEQIPPAQTIRNIVKPYVGIYRASQQQKTAKIEALLTDLAKPGIPELIETLGLVPVITQLRAANAEYVTLTAQRTNRKAATAKENSVVVRKRVNALYDEMTTKAFVQSVAAPTAATATFIKNLNALISETMTLYKRRIAMAKVAKKK